MTASAVRIGGAEAHDLGHRSAVADHLENLRRDERDRFGMIQLQAARAPLPRQLAGGKNQQLVDFARSEMHGPLSYASRAARSKYRRVSTRMSGLADSRRSCLIEVRASVAMRQNAPNSQRLQAFGLDAVRSATAVFLLRFRTPEVADR